VGTTTPPCKVHTVYVWRVSQGGVCVYSPCERHRIHTGWGTRVQPSPPVLESAILQTEKCQFETEKCQLETEKCQFETEKCQLETETCQLETETCQFETETCQLETEKSQFQTEKSQFQTEKSQFLVRFRVHVQCVLYRAG
jgi:hypothetical protein